MTSSYDPFNGDLIIRPFGQTSSSPIFRLLSRKGRLSPNQKISSSKAILDATESDCVWRKILDLHYLRLHNPDTNEHLMIDETRE